MEAKKKLYKAMVWTDDQKPGLRVHVFAENVFEAEKLLVEQYGTANVYGIYNEEEASRVR